MRFCNSGDWLKMDYLKYLMLLSDADLAVFSFEIVGKVEYWDNFISDKYYVKEDVKFVLNRYIDTAALCGSFCKLII